MRRTAATNAAYRSNPAVIIWHFQRRASAASLRSADNPDLHLTG
jgi:hypothetical protein